MKIKAITVTEASRNFADCVNRVRYQHVSFVLLKNGKPFARLVPDGSKICTGRELAEALNRGGLTPAESSAWRKDLAKARKSLKSPEDKWQ
jgi:prevent-host-death family protein